MGVKSATKIDVTRIGVKLFKWVELGNGDTGEIISLPKHSDRSIQVLGTFGAGGTCTIQGTNMDASETWATLNDPQGSALTVTTAKIETILENTYKIRPNITAGDGTTLLDVYLLLTE